MGQTSTPNSSPTSIFPRESRAPPQSASGLAKVRSRDLGCARLPHAGLCALEGRAASLLPRSQPPFLRHTKAPCEHVAWWQLPMGQEEPGPRPCRFPWASFSLPVTRPGWTWCTSSSSLQMVGDKPVLFITFPIRNCTERALPSISQLARALGPPPTDPSVLIKQTSCGWSKSKDGHEPGGTTRLVAGWGLRRPRGPGESVGRWGVRVWSWGSVSRGHTR